VAGRVVARLASEYLVLICRIFGLAGWVPALSPCLLTINRSTFKSGSPIGYGAPIRSR
jgi:hypothetical protein